MSRGIRDLREIICVSRLNNVHNNDDICESVNQSDKLTENYSVATFYNGTIDLSPVRSDSHAEFHTHNGMKRRRLPNIKSCDGNHLEDLVKYVELINTDVISQWLCTANTTLANLTDFVATNHNGYVNFMHFWLTTLSRDERTSLCNEQYGRMVDVINIGVAKCLSGTCGGDVHSPAPTAFTARILAVAFWEYPSHFGGTDDDSAAHCLLDYLHTLTADRRTDACKSLLTHLCIASLSPPSLLQCVLSLRAFAIVEFASSIIAHYRHLVARGVAQIRETEIYLSPIDESHYARFCIAIRHEFIGALHYLMQKKNIDFQQFRDVQGRSLLMLAVSYNSVSVLQYFINNFDTSNVINCSSNTGNSALHLAVCQGNMDIVRLLVLDGAADVNISNAECDNAMPLQMATLYGQEAIAAFLVQRGALPLRTDI